MLNISESSFLCKDFALRFSSYAYYANFFMRLQDFPDKLHRFFHAALALYLLRNVERIIVPSIKSLKLITL